MSISFWFHVRGLASYIQSLQLEIVKMVPSVHASHQAARNTFCIDISVQTFDDVAGRVAHLPDELWNLAFFPAHSFKRKVCTQFIVHPI